MKILIVSFYDDNFGDVIIRLCFRELLKVALENLEQPYELSYMPLKDIEEDRITAVDMVCFAGGGLFGLSYLQFFDYLDRIITVAKSANIPVVFSSIGVNNMDAKPENEQKLTELLQQENIRALSVRDHRELFHRYAGQVSYPIRNACDPALWCRPVFHQHLAEKTNSRPLIGINVVRGGLFRDNQCDWDLEDEFDYLDAITQTLRDRGYAYMFYTNGSVLDNNTLRFYAKERHIPDDQIIYVHASTELVHTVSRFDFVIAIRMHSSIIARALGIPSVNLVWNEKIHYFYRQIGEPDAAILLENWTPENILQHMDRMGVTPDTAAAIPDDRAYMMTVYTCLFDALRTATDTHTPYTFDEVQAALQKADISQEDDLGDLRFKLNRAEQLYLGRFIDWRNSSREVREKNKEIASLKETARRDAAAHGETIKQMTAAAQQSEQTLQKTTRRLQETERALREATQRLARIDRHFAVKLYRFLKRCLPKRKEGRR